MRLKENDEIVQFVDLVASLDKGTSA